MVSERPILAIGPEGADFAQIIQATNTGVFALYSEKEKVKQTILNYFNQYKEGNLKAHAISLQQFSRKNLTSQLASILRN
jgi:hypothetical protein